MPLSNIDLLLWGKVMMLSEQKGLRLLTKYLVDYLKKMSQSRISHNPLFLGSVLHGVCE